MGAIAQQSVFEPGRNAWRVNHATRCAPLVDAKEYFEAIRWACERAERSIFFLCWDIDSRIRLSPEDPSSPTFGDFLLQLVERKPDLHIYILCWDFLFIYANERESKREARKQFGRHPRIQFYFDKTGPHLVSQHQKLVVVDDQLAFCGGLDITQRRWDTPEHPVHRKLRTDPTGHSYEPFHDVMLAVMGPVAKDLGVICRERWKRRTGQAIELNGHPAHPELWPASLEILAENAPVAVSRTVPESRGVEEVKECLALFEDSIRASKEYIYIENQYLTSKRIGDLLVERLAEENPPEIVILLRQHDSKWTEAISMSLLRTRLIKRLRAHDPKKRIRILCPTASKKEAVCTNLHSKVFIADDRFVRVGSSNLCGRSEGMDTECDLALEASDEKGRARVRSFRDRLLAEHLGISREAAASSLREHGSMLRLVEEKMGESDRTVNDCTEEERPLLTLIAPSRAIVDPENPRQLNRAIRRLNGGLFLAFAFVTLLAALPRLPYRESLGPLAAWVGAQPLAPVGMTLLFAVLTLLGCPLLPLAVAFALLLPPLETFSYAMTGALLSSSLVYFFPRWKKNDQSERLEQVRLFLGKEGFWPVVLIRLVPLAPFWIVNFCLGAVGVKFRHYLPATFLGLLPGFLMIAWFEDRVQEKGFTGWLALALAAFVTVSWLVQKRVQKRMEA